ncbi:unnamed protein product, partial [Thlaspi arvense]
MKMKTAFVIINCIILAIGNCGGPLMTRLYFRNAYLPVSTSSLIISSQLAFTALFAFFMVKQRFTHFTVNAIVLITLGAGILALHTDADKLAKETHKEYIVGFLMTVGAAVLYAFILPLVELTYKKARQQISYTLVLEIQMVLSSVATCVCLVGMVATGEFKVEFFYELSFFAYIIWIDLKGEIAKEARDFKLGGSTYYYVVVAFTPIIWQGFFLGSIGIIFCASSLVSGILISTLLPLTEVLAVLCFRENFQAEKGISLFLTLWGFLSYFYGQIKYEKKKKKTQAQTQAHETQLPQLPVADSAA